MTTEPENSNAQAADAAGQDTPADPLQEEREKAQKFLTNWQRAEADFQNYKRRVDQEKQDLLRYGAEGIIRDVLAVIDDLDRAMASVTETETVLAQGIELTRRNFRNVLERHGVKEIPALGLPFDPHVHEAVMQGPGDEGKVVEVFKRGYALHERVVRPAMVKVGDGS